MTVIVTSAARHRIHPGAGRVYTLPVVRELPAQPADAADRFTW
jgi:hypothetical protein